MNNIEVSVSVEGERARLNQLYQEACPHFKKVEGRPPLKPLDDITGLIGDPPEGEQVICYTIYADTMIAGYAWLLEKPTSYYYILHFYIGNHFKRKGIGKAAVLAFDRIYRAKGISRSELLVSGANYLGLIFWVSLGYNTIIQIEEPEKWQTTSVEIELARNF